MAKIIVAITGASGVIYAKRLVQLLDKNRHQQVVLVSNPAREVLQHELGISLPTAVEKQAAELLVSWELTTPELFSCENINQYQAPIASGSGAADAMVVIPCTMGSVARFSQGVSSNLIERSFDVMLKEGKKIIVVPRETPLSEIHLRNLLDLCQLGVEVIPAMPAFYQQPLKIIDLVDFIVGRVLEHLGLEHSLYRKWNSEIDS